MKSIVLTDILVDYTKHLHKDDEDRTTKLHVTDVTARCPVGTVLEKAQIVKKVPTTSGKLMRFEVGHICEEYVRKAVEHAGLLEKKQKKQYEWPELNLVGSPDVRIIGNILSEIKSTHPSAFDQMDSNPERVIKPHTHYVEQLQMYLSMEPLGTIGQLFYFSLDGRTSEHVIKYDPEVVAAVLKRAAVLNECIKTGKRPTLPPYFVQEYKKKNGLQWVVNWKVKYCAFDGIHQHCDPKLWEVLEPETTDQMLGKLEYAAKKANEKGTNPNDWINEICGRGERKEVKVIDGITYESMPQ